jgi:hypothetical protein
MINRRLSLMISPVHATISGVPGIAAHANCHFQRIEASLSRGRLWLVEEHDAATTVRPRL